MANNFIIRKAKITDAPACQRLGRVPEIAITPGWFLPLRYYRALARAKSIFLVAEVSKKIIGFVIAEKIESGYLVQYMVVQKNYRRSGIGKALLSAVEKEARKRKAYFLLGYAVMKSKGMQVLLKQLGWHRAQPTYEWSKGLWKK